MSSAGRRDNAPARKPARWNVRDFTASIVVFLVAMPLCMGIAIASGVPPEKGLITGIIGGLVVGALAGRRCRSAAPPPASRSSCSSWCAITASALGPILMLAGVIQVAPAPSASAAGSARSRRPWCTACSPGSAC
jgi:MFS superfamily sulfate permease-like transporter